MRKMRWTGRPVVALASVVLAGIALTGDHIPGGKRWAPPLGKPLHITAPFLTPPHPYAAGHRGFDIPSSSGEAVVAPTDGVVSFAGTVVDRPLLSIRVDARTVLSLEPVTTKFSVGDLVEQGSELGLVAGETSGGHCGTTCLHIGVRIDGEYVNPLRFFAGRPKLLPW